MDLKNKDYIKIRSKPKYFIFLCIYYLLFPLAKIMYGRKNNWIICERGTDAQDNGFAFFKFLREKHPEINAVYLIKKSSSDYEKVNQIGKTVEYGSFKHFFYAIGFPVKISSHLFGYANWVQFVTYLRRRRTKDIHVFLQHGITKNDQPSFYEENCKSLKLFICGAKPEFEYIKSSFHYNNEVPAYTGFARFDALNSYSTKRELLFMPTWRRNLDELSEETFASTDFFKKWSELISNKLLITICKKTNFRIKFYLHNSFQKYSHLFANNSVVSIVRFSDENVQNLLKESKLLVTDYSSVYYDFAYMQKPCIFYQFDEEDYYKNHYSKGYFDYRRDGFGDVCTNLDDIVESIISTINSGFILDSKYKNNIDSHFLYHDNLNSNRIYNKILDLMH